MRKAPQRVGKSASATFFTLSNAMCLFYFAGGGGRVTGTVVLSDPSQKRDGWGTGRKRQGLKPQIISWFTFGTTKVVPLYKARMEVFRIPPITKARWMGHGTKTAGAEAP